MRYDPEKHHRRSIRLQGFDYRQSAVYMITMVTHARVCLFGEIVSGQMCLNLAGRMIENTWQGITARFPGVELDEFIVMPNHFHGLLIQHSPSTAPRAAVSNIEITPAQTSLGRIVGAFKSITTCEYISAVQKGDFPSFEGKIWQRNYYEHIIRNEHEWMQCREYICANPMRWSEDSENQPHK